MTDVKTWAFRIVRLLLLAFIASLLLGASTLPLEGFADRVRVFTRDIEFDYIDWTLDALVLKWNQYALGDANYIPADDRRYLVAQALDLTGNIQRMEGQIFQIYADPDIADPTEASAELRAEVDRLIARRAELQPLAEAVFQEQVSAVIGAMGLTYAGQPVPPVLYHSTPLPLALVVSPRAEIRQDAHISLQPGMTVAERAALEDQVDEGLDVSSLVVNIGGVGLYPTMVQETSNLNWLSEIVAHEWVHNFLTLRPLGISYYASPELRTMNETAASIAGKEMGQALIERFYPELLPEPGPAGAPQSAPAEPPAFDFYQEMRITRERVDELLAQGEIEAAEAYMDARREVFWENGYAIRKLNQAYFAFHGAYADHPSGGAAGKDPVGEAVRQLRAQSESLADFLNRISWMTSFEQLQNAVGAPQK